MSVVSGSHLTTRNQKMAGKVIFLLRGGAERRLARDSSDVRALIEESPVLCDMIEGDDSEEEVVVPLPACGAHEFDVVVAFFRSDKTFPPESYRNKKLLFDLLGVADAYALDEVGRKAAVLLTQFDVTTDFDQTIQLLDTLLTTLLAKREKEGVEAKPTPEPTLTEGMGWMRLYENCIKKRARTLAPA